MAGAYPIGSIAGLIRVTGASAAQRDILGVQRSMTLTGESATKAAAGIGRTDEALAGAASSSTKAATGTAKYRAAQLSALAASERYNAVLMDEDATLRQLATAEAAVIRANERVKASALSTAAPVRALGVEADTSTTMLSRAATSMGGLTKTAAGLGVALGGFELAKKAAEFVGAGRDLTTALNGVQAASHATDVEMKTVRSEAIGLGKDLTVPKASAVDAADAIQDLVRSGMTLPRAMAAARPALLLAAAAQTDTADAARFLGDTLDDFQLPADQAAHVANVLAGAATSAGGGLTDMFTAIKYAGPYARAAQVPVEDLTTVIADLAKGGIQGSMAGAGLRMVLQSLAKDSPTAEKALADLGVEAFDAQGRFVGLRDLIGQLHDAQGRFGDDSKRFLADISTAFGARASTIVASLAHKGVEGYDQFAARVGSGDVQKYADLMQRGFAAAMTQIHKQLTAAGIDVYDKLEPALVSAGIWLGTDLPHDIGVLAHILAPTINLVGDGLGDAWKVATVSMHAAEDVLGPIVRFLEQHEALTTGVATGVLSMWAAWKAWTIARAAIMGIGDLLSGLGAKMTATALVPERISAAVLTAGTNTQLAAVQMGAAWTTVGEEATTAAATTDAAAVGIVGSADAAAAGVDEAGAVAATGWTAMLGPLAAVGLGVGLLTTLFHSDSAAAQDNAAEVQSLTDAIKADSGALGDNTRAQVANSLEKSGALDAARTLGQNLHDLTTIVLQGGPRLARYTDYLRLFTIGSTQNTAATEKRRDAAVKLIGAIGGENSSVNQAVQAYKNQAAAAGKSTDATNHHAAAVGHVDTAQQKQNKTAEQALGITNQQAAASARLYGLTGTQGVTAYLAAAKAAADNIAQTKAQTLAYQAENDAASLLQQALDGLAGKDLSVATARTSSAAALRELTKAFHDNGSAIDDNSKKGIANQQAIQQQVQTDQALASAIGNATKSGKAEIQSLKDSRDAALAKAKAQGVLTPAMQAYITKLYDVKDISDYLTKHPTKFDADTKAATARLHTLIGLMDQVNRMNPTVHVGIAGGSTTPGHYTPPGRASGGSLPEGVSSVGERGPELAVKSGSNVAILSNPQSKSFLAATGMKAPGFAGGTSPTPTGERATLNPRSFLGASTLSAEQSAFSSLIDIARRAGLGYGIIGPLQQENKALDAMIRERSRLANSLDAANAKLAADEKKRAQEIAAVKGAITGSFDVTTAGTGFDGNQPVTGSSMLAQEKQDAARAKLFVADMKKLSGKVGSAYLYQLAEKGPDALPEVQALLSLSPKQLRGFRGAQGSLAGSGTALGTFIGRRRFGGTIGDDKDARAAAKRALHQQEQAINHAAGLIVKQLEHAVEKLDKPKINIYLPNGKQLATVVKTGSNQNGRRA